MPTPGDVWESDTWDSDAWAADTWGDAVEVGDSFIQKMKNIFIIITKEEGWH